MMEIDFQQIIVEPVIDYRVLIGLEIDVTLNGENPAICEKDLSFLANEILINLYSQRVYQVDLVIEGKVIFYSKMGYKKGPVSKGLTSGILYLIISQIVNLGKIDTDDIQILEPGECALILKEEKLLKINLENRVTEIPNRVTSNV